MLLNHIDFICTAGLIVLGFLFLCMAYTYMVNLRRSPEDTKKSNYHPLAVIISPLAFPLFLTLGLCLFVLRVLVFLLFLMVFTILLIAIRKPFIFELWHRFATAIGDPLLKANTFLIRMALDPRGHA